MEVICDLCPHLGPRIKTRNDEVGGDLWEMDTQTAPSVSASISYSMFLSTLKWQEARKMLNAFVKLTLFHPFKLLIFPIFLKSYLLNLPIWWYFIHKQIACSGVTLILMSVPQRNINCSGGNSNCQIMVTHEKSQTRAEGLRAVGGSAPVVSMLYPSSKTWSHTLAQASSM